MGEMKEMNTKELDVSRNQLGPLGLVEIMSALKKNRTLTKLNISLNHAAKGWLQSEGAGAEDDQNSVQKLTLVCKDVCNSFHWGFDDQMNKLRGTNEKLIIMTDEPPETVGGTEPVRPET